MTLPDEIPSSHRDGDEEVARDQLKSRFLTLTLDEVPRSRDPGTNSACLPAVSFQLGIGPLVSFRFDLFLARPVA